MRFRAVGADRILSATDGSDRILSATDGSGRILSATDSSDRILSATVGSDGILWGYSQFRWNFVGLQSVQTEFCGPTVGFRQTFEGYSWFRRNFVGYSRFRWNFVGFPGAFIWYLEGLEFRYSF